MKVKKFLLVSLILTVLMIAVLIVSLIPEDEHGILVVLNLFIAANMLGSWILTLIDAVSYLFNKPYIKGLKSYSILTLVIFAAALIFSVISIIFEKGFKGSSAELIVFYMLPLLAAEYILLRYKEKKNERLK